MKDDMTRKATPLAGRVLRCAILLLVLSQTAGSAADSSGGWIDLFNGRDLTGWRENRFAHDPHWEVKDGVLIGKGGQGYLASEKEFSDFELIAEIRI